MVSFPSAFAPCPRKGILQVLERGPIIWASAIVVFKVKRKEITVVTSKPGGSIRSYAASQLCPHVLDRNIFECTKMTKVKI